MRNPFRRKWAVTRTSPLFPSHVTVISRHYFKANAQRNHRQIQSMVSFGMKYKVERD